MCSISADWILLLDLVNVRFFRAAFVPNLLALFRVVWIALYILATSIRQPIPVLRGHPRGVYRPNRLNRRLLVTTETLEKAIAPAANIGLSNPAAASGIIAML